MQEISNDNLPLSVREYLMRGQEELAIQHLAVQYKIEKEQAKQLIDDYKSALRERKIALDIAIINEENIKSANEGRHELIKWSSRILVIFFVLLFFYLINI